MVPHLNGRAVTLRRFPEGVDDLDSAFFEKRCPKHRPKWVKTTQRAGRAERRQHRLLRLRRPADAGLDGAAGGDRAAPLALARAGADAADRARLRPRPRPAGRRRRLLPGGAAPARDVRPLRRRVLPQDLGLEGHAGLRPAQHAKRHLRGDQTVRQSDRPAARKADPDEVVCEDGKKVERSGKVFVDWSQNHRTQNDDRRLLAARPRAPDRLDPGHLGGGREPPPSRRRHARSSSRRATCWSGSRSTATSSPRCWS